MQGDFLATVLGSMFGAEWHYRLCQRQRTIPLGWTIGDATTAEMREQLTGAEGAADNAGNTLGIVGEFGL